MIEGVDYTDKQAWAYLPLHFSRLARPAQQAGSIYSTSVDEWGRRSTLP